MSVDFRTQIVHQTRHESLCDYAEEPFQMAMPKRKTTILFLASNPMTTDRLRLDAESRNIRERIQRSDYRDSIQFETRWAVRVSDILQAINETNPTIIHFSGHGCDTGELVFEYPDGSKRFVSPEAISQAISTASDTVKLVVFNACYSSVQAKAIVKYINYSIGMSTSIGDDAAGLFAAQFYSSVGFGRSLDVAFKQAIVALVLEDIREDQTPELYCKEGLLASDIVFVENSKKHME